MGKMNCPRSLAHTCAGLWLVLLSEVVTACAAPRIAQPQGVEPSEAKLRVEEEPREEPRIVLVGNEGLFSPQFECMDWGCPPTVRCGQAVCSVVHCGKGACSFCPEPMPDVFKNLVFKCWCSYGCMTGTQRTGSAYGLIAAIGGMFAGPWCVDTDLPGVHTAGAEP
jgi:hypothetical protein